MLNQVNNYQLPCISIFIPSMLNQVRNVFTLWCAVTPTFHRDAIESLPQVLRPFVPKYNNVVYIFIFLPTFGKTLFSA